MRQLNHMEKMIGEFTHKALPIAAICLLYISVYYANVEQLTF